MAEFTEEELLFKLRHHVLEAASACQVMAQGVNCKTRYSAVAGILKDLSEAASCTKGVAQYRKDPDWQAAALAFGTMRTTLKRITLARISEDRLRGHWYALHLGLMTVCGQFQKMAEANSKSVADKMLVLDRYERKVADYATNQRRIERAAQPVRPALQ